MLLKPLKILTAAIISLALFCSCAKAPKETPPELYWPFPPEKPRVKFLDVIMGSVDVLGPAKGFRRLVFGEEKEATFIKPLFVAARDDVMYVTDLNIIHVYDFGRKKFRLIRGGFKVLTGIAVAGEDAIFVGDSANSQVFRIDLKTGSIAPIEGIGMLDTPGGLAFDEVNGRLIVPDVKKHHVRIYDSKGKYLFTIGGRGTEPGFFNFPVAAAVDKEGRICIVDSGNFRIQTFDKDGKFISAFGAVGTAYGHFSRPKGIAVDSEGHIYAVDAAFGNVQIFDIFGNLYLAFGVSGVEPGKFLLPVGIAIDEKDKIYVVDQMNKRVQMFQYLKYPDESPTAPVR